MNYDWISDHNNLICTTETPGPSTQSSWQPVQLNLRGRGVGSIIFEGSIGLSYSGDIAIDDISVSSGICGTQVCTTMGILAYLFPFQPIRIQTCKHTVNILYRKAYAGVPCPTPLNRPPVTPPFFTLKLVHIQILAR